MIFGSGLILPETLKGILNKWKSANKEKLSKSLFTVFYNSPKQTPTTLLYGIGKVKKKERKDVI